MVEIICKICGKKYDDKRHDMLVKKGIASAKRVCCDDCVEKIFKQNMLIDSQIKS